MESATQAIIANYNWLGSVLSLLLIILFTKVGKYLLFKVPALAHAKQENRREDKQKLAKEKYPPMVKANQKVGFYLNVTFFLLVLPFCVTLTPQAWWQVLLDIVVVLMVYDFFYYLMHRFLFHGQGRMRQVHAVHHQARNPTYIDSHYVHPLETFMGLALFFLTVAVMAAVLGAFHITTIVAMYILYVQLNQINHTRVDLPYFPFRVLTWITVKHHKHHENMHKGNYSTITLLWDRLFGTFE